jgi:sporulation protein YlmC with PRC-barrel domain
MKTQWGKVALTAIIVLSLIGGVAVANENEPKHQTMDQMQFQPKLEKANELIGAKVLNREGNRLGTIEDIVLTPQRDAISYVALSHGGFLGFGGKLYAVPWSAFETGAKENALILNIDETYFKTAKSFDKGNWPIAADKSWLEGVGARHEYGEYGEEYGEQPQAESRREPMSTPQATERVGPGAPSNEMTTAADIKYRRLTELIGMTVKNPQNAELGELDNVVIDTQQGKVAYGILSVSSSFLGVNKKLAAVPWSAIEINDRLGTAMLNADKATLQAIAFDEKNFPNLADPQYSRDLHQRFNARPYWEALGFVPGEPRDREGYGTMPPSTSGREYSNEYNKMFNPNEVKTLHGTIESVGIFTPEGTSVSQVRLRIRTDDGQLLTVHAGPRSYLEQNNISFHHGDEVTVMGSPAKIGWRDVILASQIKKGGQTLDLRSKEGRPLWNVEEPRSVR